MIPLHIYIDFKSPASYLLMKPTLAILTQLQISAQWHPFASEERPPSDRQPDETVGERHRRVRAQVQRDMYIKYAAIQNIPMHFRPDSGASDLALAALLHINTSGGDPVDFIQVCFHTYWAQGRDLNDKEQVHKILCETGHCADGFDAEASLRALADHRAVAEEHKIFMAATYLLDGERFIGREHLPWIKEQLAKQAK